jgi:hypothetical protein
MCAAFLQSSLPQFLPNRGKLSPEVMPAGPFELEPCPCGPTRAVPRCVSAHPQTGLACHQRGVPPAGFSHPTSSRTGRCLGHPLRFGLGRGCQCIS